MLVSGAASCSFISRCCAAKILVQRETGKNKQCKSWKTIWARTDLNVKVQSVAVARVVEAAMRCKALKFGSSRTI